MQIDTLKTQKSHFNAMNFQAATKPLMELPVARFKIPFQGRTTWRPNNQEARFRGKLGFRLREKCCPYTEFSKKTCQTCDLSASCLYISLFDPTIYRRPADPNKEKRVPVSAVRPFVLAFHRCEDRSEGDNGRYGEATITLFGSAIAYSSIFIESAALALSSFPLRLGPISFDHPINNSSAPHESMDDNQIAHPLYRWVKEPDPRAVAPEAVSLQLVTPMRLKKSENPNRNEVSFALLVKTTVRRLRDLKRAFHMDGDMGALDSRFHNAAKAVIIDTNRLRWVGKKRYSHRQKKEIYLNGFVGDIRYAGPVAPFMTLLGAAEIVHAGRGISSGNGRLSIAPSLPTTDNPLQGA